MKPFLFLLPAEYHLHRLLAHIQHFCPVNTKVLRSEKILIRDRTAEEAHVIRLDKINISQQTILS